jgi:hypothetical protein
MTNEKTQAEKIADALADWAESLEAGLGAIREISLNPAYLKMRTPRETMATLVHEMCHLWQQVYGKPSRGGYHNAEWADAMDRVGLTPSTTAAPGGARTGQKVSHYIAIGGAFERAFEALPEGARLPFVCDETPRAKAAAKRASKSPYVCGCGCKVWGKPGLRLTCDTCGDAFEVEENK